jgi:hypothetical protein
MPNKLRIKQTDRRDSNQEVGINTKARGRRTENPALPGDLRAWIFIMF